MNKFFSSMSAGMRILVITVSVLLVASLVAGGFLLSGTNTLRQERDELTEELAVSAEQVESLDAQLKGAQDAAAAAQQEHETALTALEDELTAYKASADAAYSALSDEFDTYKADAETASAEAAQAITGLQTEFDDYKASAEEAYSALSGEFDTYKADSLTALAEAQAAGEADVQAAQAEAAETLAALQTAFDTYKTDSQAAFDALTDEFTAFKADSELSLADAGSQAQALADLQTEFDTYKTDSQAEFDALTDEFDAFKADSELAAADAETSAQADKDAAALALSDLQAEFDAYKANADTAFSTLSEQFSAYKTSAETKLADAEAAGEADVQAAQDAAAETLAALQTEFDSFKADADAAYAALSGEFDTYKTDADAALTAAVSDAVAAGEADVQAAQDAAAETLAALQEEYDAYRAAAEADTELTETKQQLADAQRQLILASIPGDENGAGNHINGMLAYLYDGDIIYSNFYDTGNIYAENTTGHGDTLLRNISSDESDPLYNILGSYNGWLYYRHSGCFFRYNETTGKNEMLIHAYQQPPSSGIQVVGDTLYFLGLPTDGDGGYTDNLWSMDENGAYMQCIPGVRAGSFVSDGQYLYFASLDSQALVRFDPADNTQSVLLNNVDADYLNYADGMLYFTLGGQLVKMPVSGTEPVSVGGISAGYVNVTGEWIYYVNTGDNNTLYRITTGGLYNEKLCDAENVGYVNIVDGWVYFLQLADADAPDPIIKSCKVRLDGSDLVLSKP